MYDKAHSNRDENTRQEDLLWRFFDGLYNQKARFQVEYVKEPRDIDEAVYQVVDFQETRNPPLYNEGNGDRRGKKHACAATYVSTEYEDSDYDGDNVEQRCKLMKNRVVRKAGNTVNSEIFARTLILRNFAYAKYAKFRENKTLAKWQNHSVVY